jgi:hypothetical protein
MKLILKNYRESLFTFFIENQLHMKIGWSSTKLTLVTTRQHVETSGNGPDHQVVVALRLGSRRLTYQQIIISFHLRKPTETIQAPIVCKNTDARTHTSCYSPNQSPN